jgi:hypothetical protein
VLYSAPKAGVLRGSASEAEAGLADSQLTKLSPLALTQRQRDAWPLQLQ